MRVHELRDVARADGPFASVYLDASHDTEDAARQNELRWATASAELNALGADEPTIAAARDAVLGSRPPVGRAGRCVVAARGEVLVNEVLPTPPAQPVARYSDLPYLMPLLAAAPRPVAHVVVVADKRGGWFRVVNRDGAEVPVEPVHASGRDVHPVSGGGFAHGRIENRAEQTTRNNEKEVAERVAALVEQVGAEVLVVVGEVQARSRLVAALPQHCQRIATELDADAEAVTPDRLLTEVDRLLAQHEAEWDAQAVDRLRTGFAHGTARQGLTEVTESLRIAQVETLLVTDPAMDDRTVFVGTDRNEVVANPDELPDAGTLAVERADEALPVAAIATAADVLVLTGGQAGNIKDGVAALLRFPT
jgi:alkylated DNA nucleotide flippase Atl1